MCSYLLCTAHQSWFAWSCVLKGCIYALGLDLSLRLDSSQLNYVLLIWNKKFWRAEGLDRIFCPSVAELYKLAKCYYSAANIVFHLVTLIKLATETHYFRGNNVTNLVRMSWYVHPYQWQKHDVTAYLLRSKCIAHHQQLGAEFFTHQPFLLFSDHKFHRA